MLLSCHQNSDQIRDVKKNVNKCQEFKYLGKTVTKQNLIQEEIKRRLNSGNACYYSVHYLLSFRLLSKT
jgi:hypothetical protein